MPYEVEEQVLLLLQLIGKLLQAKYCGPYMVVKRLGEISTPDHRKAKRIVPVNLFRKFIAQPSVSNLSPVALIGSGTFLCSITVKISSSV